MKTKPLNNPKKLPSGIILLIVLWSLAAFMNLLGVASRQAQIFGIEISGYGGSLVHLFFFAVLLFLIFGIRKLDYKAWMLAVIWNIFMVFSSIMSAFFPLELPAGLAVLDLTVVYIIFGIIGVVLNGIVIWYLFKKRDLFKTGKDSAPNIDKRFIITYLVSFGVCMLVIIAGAFIVGLQYAKNFSAQANEVQTALNSGDVASALDICRQKPEIEKDTCFFYVMMFATNQTGGEAAAVCGEISSDEYKMSCIILAAIKTKDTNVCLGLPATATEDIRNTCLGAASKDASYCDKISSAKEKQNCMDLAKPGASFQ